MDSPLRVPVGPLIIDYAEMTNLDGLCSTMLFVAEEHDLLEFFGETTDGFFLVFVRGRKRLLRMDEVPGYILGLFDQAGLDITPVAYRTGLRSGDTTPPSGDGDSGVE